MANMKEERKGTDKMIHETVEKIKNTSTPAGSNVSTATTSENSTTTKSKISIEDPKKFIPTECIDFVLNTEIINDVSEIMRNSFKDYVGCFINYNPKNVSALTVKVRFRLHTKEELEKIKDDRLVAIDTPTGVVTTTNNSTIDTLQKMQATIKNTSEYAVLTEDGKDCLEQYMFRNEDGKIDWKKSVSSNFAPQIADNGASVKAVYLEVDLDLNRVLESLFNGTPEACSRYKENSKYHYQASFFRSIYGNIFEIMLRRVDHKRMSKKQNELGMYSMNPGMYMY